jgi:hypothetical protein
MMRAKEGEMSEQPRAPRYELLFPMRLETKEAGPGFAVSRNISTSGSLIATASELKPGAPVTLRLQFHRDDQERWVEGVIIRVIPNEEDPYGMWPYLVGVQFTAALPELEPLLKQQAEHSKGGAA